MTTFQNDIWYLITKYLKPRELFKFLLTNHRAKHIVGYSQVENMTFQGPILHHFDRMFAEYD